MFAQDGAVKELEDVEQDYDGGKTDRRLLTTEMLTKIVVSQKAEFKRQFGREMTGTDPVFFDPWKNSPTPLAGTELTDKVFCVCRDLGVEFDRVRRYFGA